MAKVRKIDAGAHLVTGPAAYENPRVPGSERVTKSKRFPSGPEIPPAKRLVGPNPGGKMGGGGSYVSPGIAGKGARPSTYVDPYVTSGPRSHLAPFTPRGGTEAPDCDKSPHGTFKIPGPLQGKIGYEASFKGGIPMSHGEGHVMGSGASGQGTVFRDRNVNDVTSLDQQAPNNECPIRNNAKAGGVY